MANSNRAALIAKMHKVLKHHYKPVDSEANRPLLETLLFACCLENAPYETAEKIYARVQESFFDWNEVRVSTVAELAEAMRGLPDPAAAASNLKRILQSVFESTYSFDLEALKKEKIGQGVNRLAEFEGSTPFVVAYATQNALAGHAIPLDQGTVEVLVVLGVLSESEAEPGSVSAIDRSIPKNKGIEFASLLHQLGADYVANPHSPNLRNILVAIAPEAKDRLPKRSTKKETKEDAAEGETAGRSPANADSSSAKKQRVEKPVPDRKASGKSRQPSAADKKKPPTKQLSKRKPR